MSIAADQEKKFLPRYQLLFHLITSYYTFALVVAFCAYSYIYLDQPIAIFMHQAVTGELSNIANFITEFGISTYYIIFSALLFLLFQFIWRKRKIAKSFLFICLAVVVPGILCDIIKIIAGRYRPTLFLGQELYGFSFFKLHAPEWSFPSGHSTTITGLMLALLLLFPRLWYLCLAVIVLVCSSRIMLTAHYLSDVIFGIYMSSVTVLFIYKKLYKENLIRA